MVIAMTIPMLPKGMGGALMSSVLINVHNWGIIMASYNQVIINASVKQHPKIMYALNGGLEMEE
jgi:hypothetical protein